MLAGTIHLSSLNKCWCTMHLWSNTNSSRSCCCKACGRTATHLHGVCSITRYDKAHTSPCPEGTSTPASSANLSSKRCAAAEASHRLCIQVTSLTFHATLTSRMSVHHDNKPNALSAPSSSRKPVLPGRWKLQQTRLSFSFSGQLTSQKPTAHSKLPQLHAHIVRCLVASSCTDLFKMHTQHTGPPATTDTVKTVQHAAG